MYDRSRRPEIYQPCSTGDAVGPGTYDPQIANRSRVASDGYAPFLSMTSRDTHINAQDTSIAAPGPGQYDPRLPLDNVKGGVSVSNRSRRFVETESLVPGPGHYNVRSHGLDDDRQRAKKAYKENRPRLVIERKPDAPSIPTPGQAYGFEENEDGTLRRQEPPPKDASLGPAYYRVDESADVSTVTKVYRGNHWSKMASKRLDLAAGKEGPGPGQYEVVDEKVPRAAENVNLPGGGGKSAARQQPRLPRYHEIIVKDEEKKAVPGPGKYDIRSAFELAPSKLNAEGAEVEHPPFGVQAKRFLSVKDAVPAPGQYDDPRTALAVVKKPSGIKRTPFGQTSVRFVMEHSIRKTPGPGAYNALGLGTESMRKAYVESTRRGVFGTTSPRIQPMVKRDDYFTPGPTHYQPIEKVHEAQEAVKPTAAFTSLTTRLPEDPEAKALPPPGSYNVDDSFKQSQAKKDPAPARTAAARRRQEAFKSSSSRFAPPHDVAIDKSDPMNPGPGTYDPNVTAISLKGGLMVVKEERFRELRKDEVPGPGQYEFSPLLQDTVLKGTFNVTLGNPVAPRLRNADQIKGQHAFLLGV